MVDSSTVLDAIDRRILELLQRDGRITNAALAEEVGLTPTPLIQRVRKLEQSGAIQRYAAVVDAAKVGRPVLAFVHVTMKNHGIQQHQRLVALIDSLAPVLECHHIAGDEDFLLKVCARDIAELEQVILRDLSASGIVGRVKTTLVFSSSKVAAPIPISEVTP